MNEPHQARAPTVPRTGRPNREPLDADEVIAYAIALAKDLGVLIPKRKRLHRMLKRRIPIPQIYQGADYRLWIDRYYIAAQRLADESVRYVYLTRIHIRSELLANRNSILKNGFALLDSEALAEFAAALPDGLCPAPFQPHGGQQGAAESGRGMELRVSVLPDTGRTLRPQGQRKSRRAAAIQKRQASWNQMVSQPSGVG